MVSTRNLNSQRWLDAYTEPHASLYTFSHCMAMADLNADGDYKLLVADLGTGTANMKLKVYRGTSLMSENTLIDIPTGVVSFYMDTNEPRFPAVAVASGSNIFIYKNMRPYFKFSLPSMEMNTLEKELWTNVGNRSMEVEVLHEMLESVRDEVGFSKLTPRSQQFLILDHSKQKEFVEKHRELELKKQAIVTCITTLNKNSNDPQAVSCLVLGTENGDLYFLDPQAFTILETVPIGDGVASVVPVHLVATGLYDVEYRIIAACRDGSINLCRRGYKQAKPIVRLSSQCVAMVILENGNIILATMDQTIHCYSKSGKKQWLVKVAGCVMSLATVPLAHLGLTLIAVALKDGSVHFYSGRDVVDVLTFSDAIAAMRFGRFGQEEHSLILVTAGGCLMVKILKRTAQFSEQSSTSPSALPSQQIKFSIPKKTKLFVEQTMREREGCMAMHCAFQKDLFRLRLNTARACAQALQSGSNPLSRDVMQPLKMSAQVLGLGPVFKVRVTLENMSAANPSIDLCIVFHFDEKSYIVDKPFIRVPMLVPSLTYNFETMVRCVSEMGVSDQIRIFVVRPDQTQPVLAALIDMPVCDMLNVV